MRKAAPIEESYGRLTVLRRVASSKGGDAQYLCRCACGNEKVIRGYSLRIGDTESCGCLRKSESRRVAPIRGTYGRLRVEERVGKRGPRAVFRASCSCGTTMKISAEQLRRGTQSCGCLNIERTKESWKRRRFRKNAANWLRRPLEHSQLEAA